MILFVGLGNPTNAYQNTRHNFGFMVIDNFIKNYESTLINKPKFKGLLFKSKSFLALKPMTYMNLSGESLKVVNEFYKPKKIVVLHDDLDLPLGTVRFKKGGSCAGHNGLKSIDLHVNNNYERIRLGIGKPLNKDEVVRYVLEDFKKEECLCVQEVINHCVEAMKMLLVASLEEVSSKFTCKKSLC